MSRERLLRGLLAAVRIVVFAALVALLYLRLGGGDPSKLPSALIGKPAPTLTLPPLENVALPGLDPRDFTGRVTLINVWGSWCGPCRDEHRFLARLAAGPRGALGGDNHKSKPDKARGGP